MLQPELLSVSPKEDYKLLLLYENGEKKIFDVSPYISGKRGVVRGIKRP